MIRVSVLYPQKADGKFDMDYYINKHMTMLVEKLGGALVKSETDKGIAGAMPGTPAPFIAAAHLYFNSVDEFQEAFAPHVGAIMGDVPNYTDITPQVQISEIVS